MSDASLKTRIEVLVDEPLLRRVVRLSEQSDISGYTVLPTLEGAGRGGKWFDERVSGGAGSKVIFLTICGQEKADRFIETLRPMLEEYGLIVTRAQVEVIRPELFR